LAFDALFREFSVAKFITSDSHHNQFVALALNSGFDPYKVSVKYAVWQTFN